MAYDIFVAEFRTLKKTLTNQNPSFHLRTTEEEQKSDQIKGAQALQQLTAEVVVEVRFVDVSMLLSCSWSDSLGTSYKETRDFMPS